MAFIRRFLLHVLPKGYQRIRYFGILAIRNRKTKLKRAQALLKHKVPLINPLHWKERLEQITGVHPDTCLYVEKGACKNWGLSLNSLYQ